MLALYRFIIGLLFWICLPLLLIVLLFRPGQRAIVRERLGFYPPDPGQDEGRRRLWLHAASIGEVRAAAVLLEELRPQLAGWDFLLTTMTVHGREFARHQLGPGVPCYLAPLDLPFPVNRALARFGAAAYVCLETELWPVLSDRLRAGSIPAILVNGRLSDRSIAAYRRLRFLFAPVLRNFRAIGAISEKDRQRFIEVGADPAALTVTGNVKDDTALPGDRQAINAKWRDLLGLDADADIFIAGSTHAPEEELLLPLLQRLTGDRAIVLLAPRHLNRLAQIEALLAGAGLDHDLLRALKEGGRRRHPLILVDTFGDLKELYSVATFVFVGGSLSGGGGHNLMEPAGWGTVVFFGPDIGDFSEAAETLRQSGGGFLVAGIDQLETHIDLLRRDRPRLAETRRRAAAAATLRQGAARRQAALIVRRMYG